MNLSARKKTLLGIIGVFLIIGFGFLGWQIKAGKLFSRAETTGVAGTFSDVSVNYWAYNYIQAAALGGIVQGYADGTFKPEVIITRDQMAVFIARAVAGGDAKVPLYSSFPPPYPDVPTTHWAFKYISYVKEKGIAQGYSDGKFHPEYQVSRDQMTVFLARAIAGGDSKVPAGPATASFSDVSTSFWAYKYIEYLVANNYASGYADGTFKPYDKVTRAQMAAFMSKGWDLISTVLAANVTGKVTTSTGAVLANGYIVLNDGEDIVQIAGNGNYTLTGLDATTYEVSIYDANGVRYEAPDLASHLISPVYGKNTINFSGLVAK